MIQFIDYLKEKQQVVRYVFYGIVFAVIVWSIAVDTSHAHTWAEKHIPGFWSFFGFISCVLLIFVARWVASAGIERGDDYYDN